MLFHRSALSRASLSLFLIAIATLAAPIVGAENWHYALEIAPNMADIRVEVCTNELAQNLITLPAGARWLERSSRRLSNNDETCLSYALKVVPEKQRYFDTNNEGQVIHTSLDTILACPKTSTLASIQITIDAPSDIQVSFPGQELDSNTYRLYERPCSWSSGVLWGNLINRHLKVGGSKVRAAIPNTVAQETQEKLINWLGAGLHALLLAYGDLPVPEIQVLLFPVGPNSEAVPWGEVKRGGGDAVHLYVDQTKRLSELNADWVLVHELSHLLHPYLVSGDAWLSEGIASYYQNVLRARADLLGTQDAWRKLDAGFQRGLKQFEPSVRLLENTRSMMRNRQYMRVYWSGAAIALVADVELRRQSNGGQSLDSLLKQIASCCLPTSKRRMRARDLIERLDSFSKTTIFSQLYDRYVMQPRFPELESTYAALGIKRHAAGLDFAQSGRSLRDAIMRGD